MSKKIIFSGGGTGGHIFPAINLMNHFLEMEYKVILATDKRGNNFIQDISKFQSYVLSVNTSNNKNLLKKLFSYFLIFYSIIRSIFILIKEKPDLVFGLGGYVSFPISFASGLLNIPLIIYENNMVLGRANRYLSFFSKKILVAKKISKNFPEKYKSKMHVVGPILDKRVLNFQLDKEKSNKDFFSILVLGGSQGADIFGKIIPGAIKMIKDLDFKIEIKQQCILGQKDSIANFYNKNNIKNYVFEFDKNILKSILSSDLAITRGGASTTAELAQTLTPFIAIPIPNSIHDHQYLNAKYYEDNGCCWLMEQKNFNTKNLFNLIMEIIKNKNKLENVIKNMKKNYNKNVYQNIEKQISEYV